MFVTVSCVDYWNEDRLDHKFKTVGVLSLYIVSPQEKKNAFLVFILK